MAYNNFDSQNMMYNQGNFIWWQGKVVNVEDDPHKNGRIRVKIHGWYDDVEDEKLPWALPMGLMSSESHKGVGYSPTGVQKDSIVFGFFLDGMDAQVPIYVGTLYGRPEGESDTHWRAREEEEKSKFGKKQRYKGKKPEGGIFEEPEQRYNAKYPYNHVHYTKNKHLFEIDDTKGEQRYRYKHPKETEFEYDKDGTIIIHGVKDSWHMIDGDIYIHTNKDMFISVKKDLNINVQGNARINVDGNVKETIKGNYELKVDGNWDVQIGGNTSMKSGGVHDIKASIINLN